MRLAELTTLRVGGQIRRLIEARTEQEVISAVSAADAAGEPLLVLGGGSNLVASDAPFDGTVVLLRDPTEDEPVPPAPAATCGGVVVRHFAGVTWDRAVARAVAMELVGVEALSGIPGTVGATPIQNVGAYGQEVAATIMRVHTWDRQSGQRRTFAAADCDFGYRSSVFKRTRYAGAVPSPTGRYVVLSVEFQHEQGTLSAPIRYGELSRRLGVDGGQRAPMREVREAVLSIRASKGMVLSDDDHDTWSAGSFFTNPVLTAEQAARLPADAPRFPAGEDGELVKSSAAWLISHAGIDRGFSLGGRAAVSTKHSLALTNRGGASCEEIVDLARAVQERVAAVYGIALEPEPVRWGVDL